MTLRSSDLQSDSDPDSIRNSCDVFYDVPYENDGKLNIDGNKKLKYSDSVNYRRKWSWTPPLKSENLISVPDAINFQSDTLAK